ncbi:DUF2273 domain-containing protein [Sporanaerobacter acetigenes]|uniref:Uncharacterized membrane protein n=1 Tax=Sporanaerobacter acetigenes DSM 13106 TaxID=1123281 RepID=A0A1M5XP97_9FIRM|nr:DUF2273 domain-containing protein [Sporanaerobacter acetigenes]SHI01667.1 Uncharacterized membrane protein [Sporanaerobacter acetigenes DSM 13106]
MAKEKFLEFIQILEENKGKTIGTIIGFVIAILVLTIGFFRTLFIVLCTWFGFYLGKKKDNQEDFREILDRILPPGREK